MNNNFNDIIDVILTFYKDDEIKKDIIVYGSIVPYLIMNKESSNNISDFCFLARQSKIGNIRKKIKKLSLEYKFDIIYDSKKYSKKDYGLKIKYENTIIGFYPYSIIDNNLTIKTFSMSKDETEIKLKTKIIPNISKSSVVRYISFDDELRVRILSPEFILANIETEEKKGREFEIETIKLLRNLSDESILHILRESISKMNINIDYKKKKKIDYGFMIIVFVLLVILAFLAYVCFK